MLRWTPFQGFPLELCCFVLENVTGNLFQIPNSTCHPASASIIALCGTRCNIWLQQSRRTNIQCKDLRGNPKPRVSPDRTGPKPVRGRGTFWRIFSGRVGSGRVGSGNFISGRSGSGYIFIGVWDIFPGISGINLNLN